MRVILQRVSRASVVAEEKTVGAIERGYLILAGVTHGDTDEDLDVIADKLVHLRVFPDEEGKMNRSLLDVGGSILVVSQFTLHADCRKGRRPSFTQAAPPDVAEKMVDLFVDKLKDRGLRVETGQFGAKMDVELVNTGPVTIILDSEDLTKPRKGS